MAKVYLASAYSRRAEMRAIAAALIAAGHDITARWIDGRHETPSAGMAVDSTEHLGWAADEDVEDVAASDAVVSVTGGGDRSRGGRHVEAGIAIGLGKRRIVLGEREHVFDHRRDVEQVASVDELVALLAVLP
jgi:hypothetical protein